MPTFPTPSERFVRLLAEFLAPAGHLSEEQAAVLEDAFNDAVQARVEQREQDNRPDWE
jgi:TPP-dependent pyruvate/acetoin dehydrogenase alpha subunit